MKFPNDFIPAETLSSDDQLIIGKENEEPKKILAKKAIEKVTEESIDTKVKNGELLGKFPNSFSTVTVVDNSHMIMIGKTGIKPIATRFIDAVTTVIRSFWGKLSTITSIDANHEIAVGKNGKPTSRIKLQKTIRDNGFILASGTVKADGTHVGAFGPKASTAAAEWLSQGRYRVPHNVGNLKYNVFFSVNTRVTGGAEQARFLNVKQEDKKNSSFVVHSLWKEGELGDCSFNYLIVGE